MFLLHKNSGSGRLLPPLFRCQARAMPRPRKPDPDRKSTRLAVRLSPAERLHIEQAAHDAGLSASGYIRARLLQGRLALTQRRSLDHAAFDQIRRIGVNLNQLTRLAHQNGKMPAGLSRVCKAVEDILIREVESITPPDTGTEEMLDDIGPSTEPGPPDTPG